MRRTNARRIFGVSLSISTIFFAFAMNSLTQISRISISAILVVILSSSCLISACSKSALGLGGIMISSFGGSSVSTMVMHSFSSVFSAADGSVAFVVSVRLVSSVGFAAIVDSVAVLVGSVTCSLLTVGRSSLSFSVGSTDVTGGVVSSVITVSYAVIGGLSVGGGAVLPPHPTILINCPQ